MRTVSTKLDKKEHERLLEMCNDDGESVCEALREMIHSYCDAWEEGKEIEAESRIVTIVPKEEPKEITITRIRD